MTQCQYHPNEIAVTKCERCYRPICLMDKTIYRKRRTHGDHSYVETYEYCPICHSEVSINNSRMNMIGIVIFIIIFFVFFVPLFTGSSFTSFPLFAILLVLIAVFIYSPYQISKHKKRQESFLKTLSGNSVKLTSSQGTLQKFSKRSGVDVSCFQCGSPISLEDAFCSNCGDSTEDEKKFY